MIRQKVVLGNYIFLVDLYKASKDLVNPTYREFYLLRDVDLISGTLCDRHIYFINKEIYNKKNIIYPINNTTAVGYSTDAKAFNSNINVNNLEGSIYHIYKKENEEFTDATVLCDMLRIYFPVNKNNIDCILDVENFINDIKFHYLISDIHDYERHAGNEITYEHQLYSEYIDIYIPSLDTLLYDSSLYINEYDTCINDLTGETINEYYDNKSVIPFNTIYYPFKILTERDNQNKPIYKKNFITSASYINNQFYSTLNLIMYPYSEIDSFGYFTPDNDLKVNVRSFNMKIEVSLNTEIRFPLSSDFNDEEAYEKYYGVPCAISTFNISDETEETLINKYLKLNGLTLEDYEYYDPNDEDRIDYKEADDEYFGEELWEIKKTGFYIEMSTDKNFKDIFFTYKVNIDDINSLIDNFTFPLYGIFSDWNDVPSIIVYRITFIDKVSCNKIQSNPIIITDEWYKFLVNNELKHKLHLNKVYKYVNNNMLVGNYNDATQPILFIDKINCSIIKSDTESEGLEIVKKNAPKVIYKPIFYRTTELQNITIRSGVTQNIGINLDEYMTKVETFKLIIDQNEYIEYGRNNIFVIFKINANKISNTSGKYIITDENNEYISDGNYTIN